MKKNILIIFFIPFLYTSTIFAQWDKQFGGTTENLTDVVMLDSLTTIIAGDSGSILKTTDAGETWRNVAPEVDCLPEMDCFMSWNSVSFYDTMNGIVIGNEIIMTNDGGELWYFITPAFDREFLCALFIGPGNIFVGDDSGYVYHTIDSGKTWNSKKITNLPIRAIYAWPGPYIWGLEIFALTPHSLFIKTEFPSTQWSELMKLDYFQGEGSEAFNSGFSENGTEFIVGVRDDSIPLSTIIRLRPPDSHWYLVGPENEIGALFGLSIPSSNVVYTCGYNGKVLKSNDGGDNWFSLITRTTQTLNSIYFFDNERGFAVGDSGTILYTSNGGSLKENQPPSPFHLMKPSNEDILWSLPKSIIFEWEKSYDINNDTIYYTLLISSDTCATWKSYGPTTDTIFQVHWPMEAPDSSKSDRYYWIVIANDKMYATPSLEVFAFTIIDLSLVNENSNPTTFELYQNYPNPFNPTTTINYQIAKSGFVSLKVYDILGKEVATLVDEYKSAGKYEVEFSATNLSSGIYFYNLITEKYSQIKKLVLLK